MGVRYNFCVIVWKTEGLVENMYWMFNVCISLFAYDFCSKTLNSNTYFANDVWLAVEMLAETLLMGKVHNIFGRLHTRTVRWHASVKRPIFTKFIKTIRHFLTCHVHTERRGRGKKFVTVFSASNTPRMLTKSRQPSTVHSADTRSTLHRAPTKHMTPCWVSIRPARHVNLETVHDCFC